ncbi:MAG: HEPN domain-containing protein [Candidatus Dojkabacteria bacterium]
MKDQLRRAKKGKRYRDRYKVWYKQARYDLKAAESSLSHGFNEWAAFQSEQALEKAIKAILVHGGWKPPRLHKLQVLMGMANRVNDNFKKTKFDFRRIESFTFVSRYPFLIPGQDKSPHELIAHEDAHKAIEQATKFVDKVAEILKHSVTTPAETEQEMTDEEIYSPENVHTRLDEVKEVLVKEFKPKKIILFGRFAREEKLKKPSTMDILMIAKTDLPFIDRIVRAREVTKGSLPVIEPLVYTPSEFKVMTEEAGEGFLENALDEGKVIYEKFS